MWKEKEHSEAEGGPEGSPGGALSPLTFSRAMRACVSYTSTVNSVRTPCTWGARKGQAGAGWDAAPLYPHTPLWVPRPQPLTVRSCRMDFICSQAKA